MICQFSRSWLLEQYLASIRARCKLGLFRTLALGHPPRSEYRLQAAPGRACPVRLSLRAGSASVEERLVPRGLTARRRLARSYAAPPMTDPSTSTSHDLQLTILLSVYHTHPSIRRQMISCASQGLFSEAEGRSDKPLPGRKLHDCGASRRWAVPTDSWAARNHQWGTPEFWAHPALASIGSVPCASSWGPAPKPPAFVAFGQ
jgi:hypothetical protein